MPVKADLAPRPTPASTAPPHAPRSPPSNCTMSDHPPVRPTNGEAHALMEDQIPSPTALSVNRKKQKRRQKQAARLAAENPHLHNCYVSTDVTDHARPEEIPYDGPDLDDIEPHHSVNGDVYSDEDQDSIDAYHGVPNPSGLGHVHPTVPGRHSRKKKGGIGRSGPTIADGSSTPRSTPSVSMSHAFPPPIPPHFEPRAILSSAKDRSIWNTSTQEERENIKTFWLELGEEERRQLVKVEKDAVLKKMKEQQKHSCSCTVCGRKRTAIEEELEVLYDAYYEELEQYANNNQGSFEKNSPIVPPPRLYHPPLRSPGQHTRTHGQFHPSRDRVHELPEEDEEELEEEYDDEEEEDEPYSGEEEEDDDLEDEDTRAARADFFAFGNSLTVKDGILTVADDLLKNDGKHFIDMMEQLAERRMQREEDTQYGIAAAHQSLHGGHNHGPLDEEEYDDEEDEDYDSQEDEDYEEDEMVCPGVGPFSSSCLQGRCVLTGFSQDAMTEEQRMEEGRRMFQIFAARMFEQRVLTAYREKVAEQRQQKLIQELMDEETRNEQRSAKKAREAQKKKGKKRLQRQAKEEEKARRDSEKAAEEAATKAAQGKKLEEQRQKREEQRKKREAERKAQDEERARKEAEKQRRLREEREKQAEAERKHREKKEQEKKRREEVRLKEEKDSQEKKAKEERESKAREEPMQKTPDAKRPLHPVIPSSLPHPQGPLPHAQVASPVVRKAPTPGRPRQPSRQGSHTSSPRSQSASAEQSQVSVSPQSMPPYQSSGASSAASKHGLGQHQMPHHPHPHTPHHPHPHTPLSPLGSATRSHPPGLYGINGLPSHPPPGLSGMTPRPPMGPELSGYPPHSGSLMNALRGFPAPNGIPMPPGINGVRPMPPGRGYPLEPGHGLPFHSQQPLNNAFSPQGGLSRTHSRQPSSSFERSPLNNQAQPLPISRPSPIKRPSSTAPQDQQRDNGPTATQKDVEELSAHLGSSALLDNTDASFTSSLSQSLPGTTAPGSFRAPTRASFAAPSYFPDPLGAPKHPSFPLNHSGVGSNTWGKPLPFGASPFPGSSTWGSGPGSGWLNNAFGSGGFHRAHTSRPVTIRLLVIQACKQLNTMSPSKGASGYHEVHIVLRQIDQLRPSTEPAISLKEMLDICDTEGNPQNGGGSFLIRDDENGHFVKFEPDTNSAASGHRGSSVPGEIGSPIPNSSIPAFGGIGSSSVLRPFSSPHAGF